MSKPIYYYGMRLRGYSPMCQPGSGLIGTANGMQYKFAAQGRRYHDILAYDRELSIDELDDYELDYLGVDFHD